MRLKLIKRFTAAFNCWHANCFEDYRRRRGAIREADLTLLARGASDEV